MTSPARQPVPPEKPRSSWLASLVAGPAILLTPFVIFLRHNNYGLFHPETLICLCVVAAVGLLLGLLLVVGGAVVRTLLLAAMVAFVVDVQLEWFDSWSVPLAATFSAFAVLAWLLGPRATRVAAFAFCVMLVSTLALPTGGEAWHEQGVSSEPSMDRDAPPLFIHIILDEQIGVEGIPREFDSSGSASAALRDFYLSRGFRVFGRAYSRYKQTFGSLDNLMNFRADPPADMFSKPLASNAYFEEMTRRGYRIHVYQSDFFDFCHSPGEIDLAYCLTYDLERIETVENAPLSLSTKVQVIAGMFTRLSFLLSELRDAYGALRVATADGNGSLPEWSSAVGRVSPVSTFQLMPRIERHLTHAGRGQLFLFHLMLPHSPYAFDRHCALRPEPDEWLLNHAGSGLHWVNSPKSRARRYPLYLEQVECLHAQLANLFSALEASGALDEAIVLVHGDHGSRVSLRFSRDQRPWPDSAYVDNYSTLFAIKEPGGSADYDARLLPIDLLFTRLVRDDDLPAGVDWAGHRSTYMGPKAVPMPSFGRQH